MAEARPTLRGPAPTSDELCAALAQPMAEMFGSTVLVDRVERQQSQYASSYTIEDLHIITTDGTTIDLVLKHLSYASLFGAAREAKPKFLCDPLRELATYRTVLAHAGMETARLYAGHVDQKHGHHWMILERVAGKELYQIGELAVWQQVARWLARFHRLFWDDVQPWVQPSRLLIEDAEFFRTWPRRLKQVVSNPGIANADETEKLVEIVDRYDMVLKRLKPWPPTVLHGDFYPSNIMIGQSAQLRVCPIDWEMTSAGPGLVDLAALVSGRWTRTDRQLVVQAYYDQLFADDGPPCSFSDFQRELEWFRLHLAIQWLSWAPGWSPPQDHAHNWLQDAIDVATELGVI